MTPREKLITAPAATTLKEANDIIWDNKLNALPVVDEDDHLCTSSSARTTPAQGAPWRFRTPRSATSSARASTPRTMTSASPRWWRPGRMLCIDSSEGYSVWRKKIIDYVRANYGNTIKIGAGNVVDRDGWLPRRERRGLCQSRHRRQLHLHHARNEGYRSGQATALIEVSAARRILPRDRRVCPHLLRRRHRARLS